MLNGNRVNAIRARAQRGWSIHKIVEHFGVARNTVRRYLRQGQASVGPEAPAETFEFERKLVRQIARQLHPNDPAELESELTVHLAKLLPRKRSAMSWAGFLFDALWKKGLSWLERRKRQDAPLTSMDAPVEGGDSTGATLHDKMAGPSPPLELLRELRAVRRTLTAFDRSVLDALKAERFNKTRAAKRLDVHPNTIYNALRRVRAELMRRGWSFADTG